MEKRGILDFNHHNWIVRIRVKDNNGLFITSSYPIWSDDLIRYYPDLVNKEVNCELVLINPIGRKVGLSNVNENLSESKWYAIVDESDFFPSKKDESYQLAEFYPGCPEFGTIIRGENLQIKVITSTDTESIEILCHNVNSYWKKID